MASSTVLPSPAIAVFLPAGRPQQDWVTDGSLDDPRFDRLGKAHETKTGACTRSPSRSICGTKAFLWEPFLGLGEALVCNLNVASFMEESLLLLKALGSGSPSPAARPQPEKKLI